MARMVRLAFRHYANLRVRQAAIFQDRHSVDQSGIIIDNVQRTMRRIKAEGWPPDKSAPATNPRGRQRQLTSAARDRRAVGDPRSAPDRGPGSLKPPHEARAPEVGGNARAHDDEGRGSGHPGGLLSGATDRRPCPARGRSGGFQARPGRRRTIVKTDRAGERPGRHTCQVESDHSGSREGRGPDPFIRHQSGQCAQSIA